MCWGSDCRLEIEVEEQNHGKLRGERDSEALRQILRRFF